VCKAKQQQNALFPKALTPVLSRLEGFYAKRVIPSQLTKDQVLLQKEIPVAVKCAVKCSIQKVAQEATSLVQKTVA
jgi:hypothetical protein